LAVVGEEEGGEDAEPILFLVVVERGTQRIDTGGRVTPLSQTFWDDAVIPAGVGADQQISDERGAEGQDDAEHRLPPEAAHRLRPAAREKAGQLPPRRSLDSVNLEIGARAEPFEISDERAVQRRVAGDG